MKKHPKFFMLIAFLAVTLFCPASSKADTVAHAIWGTGIQIGWAEMGAYQGVDPRTLVQSLAYARDMARQTGCLPPDEIERLRVAMSQTGDSRMLYQPISSYRQSAHTNLQRCRCAGGQNAAWALWGLGVQIGWAEMGSYYGMDTQSVLRALGSARDHASQLNCITTSKIDDLIRATYDARYSREVFQQITAYRQQQLLSEVQRNCSCGDSSACPTGVPPQLAGKRILKKETWMSHEWWWAPGTRGRAPSQPKKTYTYVYHLADGGTYKDSRAYDCERERLRNAGWEFQVSRGATLVQ